MKSNILIPFSIKYKLLLILLSIVGAFLVMFATNRYGAVTSMDSTAYISTARNLIKGAGLIDYTGVPLVRFSPLYPILLACFGLIIGKDPLILANFVNALIFGIIVYLGGTLTFRHLSSFPGLAFLGTLSILFSVPLFEDSVSALSEPLFILFVLLSFVFIDSYFEKNDTKSIILLSVSVAFSCLTRYVGVAIIFWGALIIIIINRDRLQRRIAHFSLFILISALPIGIWLIRNLVISGTLNGFPQSSAQNLIYNLRSAYEAIIYWYIPGTILDHSYILMFVSIAAGFLVGLCIKNSWAIVKYTLQEWRTTLSFPIACGLFVIIFTIFVVISATFTVVSVGDRVLSPIYVPLILLLFILIQALDGAYRQLFPNKIVNSFLIIGVIIWLLYPIHTIFPKAVTINQTGQDYSSKIWIESQTIQYLLHHPNLESQCTVYSNGTDVTYILAHLVTKMIPVLAVYNNSPKAAISRLRGSWPEEEKACLVWYNKLNRDDLLTFDELKSIANIDPIIMLDDGEIYSITTK